jgi:hypothetical protein
MHLSVPVGRFPDLGRQRPFKIGGAADVAPAQSLYPSLTPYHAKTAGREQGPR